MGGFGVSAVLLTSGTQILLKLSIQHLFLACLGLPKLLAWRIHALFSGFDSQSKTRGKKAIEEKRNMTEADRLTRDDIYKPVTLGTISLDTRLALAMLPLSPPGFLPAGNLPSPYFPTNFFQILR